MRFSSGLALFARTHTPQVIKSLQLGRKATMDTQELLVHDSCKWQGAERVHDGIVHGVRVLMLAYFASVLSGYDRTRLHSSLKVK
jgi:hypothetical protein